MKLLKGRAQAHRAMLTILEQNVKLDGRAELRNFDRLANHLQDEQGDYGKALDALTVKLKKLVRAANRITNPTERKAALEEAQRIELVESEDILDAHGDEELDLYLEGHQYDLVTSLWDSVRGFVGQRESRKVLVEVDEMILNATNVKVKGLSLVPTDDPIPSTIDEEDRDLPQASGAD